ncbi:glycerate kinase [Fodinicurvata sp. EGI_FJ10296]|uniref:glycerate kinase type-2 family protein n=1 Tax=Fodinicurvata sp. EGI_FJ10296 TaxID=3231908 RepID=UPI003456FA03
MPEPEALLRQMFDAAVRAARPEVCVPAHLPAPPIGRTIVIGAGKASAAMAAALENAWDGPVEGLVVTRYGHTAPCRRIEIVEAAHPVPDAAGLDAAERILALVQTAGPDDLVIALISGGGSSLLALPAPGLTLDDKQAVARALLRSGATIHEMNAVRKHLSAVKGGQLAAAVAPARLHTILISDVPGDDPSVIASGPTVPDPSTLAEARSILAKYAIDPSAAVAARLNDPAAETPKPGDPVFAGNGVSMAATPLGALQAASVVAKSAGVAPVILSDRIEGEAADVALVHAAIARHVADAADDDESTRPIARPPCVLLSGGETTVTVKGGGRGGRNAEFLTALTADLAGKPGIWAMACDTDGIDGSEDNAGVLMTPNTFHLGLEIGASAQRHLEDNDGYGYFAAVGGLVITGPTQTNVNDFRAILIMPVP